MLVRALVSFSGKESMAMGEIRELTDESIVTDLLNAGYVIEYKADEPVEEKPKKRKGKKDEG